MSENKIVIVQEIIQGSKAISSDDGEQVYSRLNHFLNQGKKVELDFSGIDLIVSTFLNASVGQLYGAYSSEFVKGHLSVINMSNDDLSILKKVVVRAKQYFADREGFSTAVDNAMNNG